MHRYLITSILVFVALFWSTLLYALPDRYPGDTSIYGGTATATSPNVLIIVDTSGSMQDLVAGSAEETYNPAKTYPELEVCKIKVSGGWWGSYYTTTTCSANAVYYDSDDTKLLNSVDSVTTACGSANPQNLLKTAGTYKGKALNSNGSCNTNNNGTYNLGNYMNWLNGPGQDRKKIDIAKDVVKNIIQTTSGVNFGLMRYRSDDEGGQFIKASVSGKDYVTTIKNMDEDFTTSLKNRDALLETIDTLPADGATPLAETLYEAYRYFNGGASAFSNTIGLTNGLYTSPIASECQKSYVIFVTDGASTADDNSVLKSFCTNGDCDGDSKEPVTYTYRWNTYTSYEHSLDDVAKYLYDTKKVITYTIGFDLSSDTTAVELLKRAADSSHGHGAAYLAGNQAELTKSITQIVSNILVQDSSFVAPVVPVSPENRTASATRVYIGLFKPMNGMPWQGNLKKYGLDSNNYLTDRNGDYANYVDLINNTTKKTGADGLDDRTGTSNVINGAFLSTSSSFWGTTQDGGKVALGGVGEKLLTRSNARNIYTNKDTTQADLTLGANPFNTTNITKDDLDLTSDSDRDKLVNFIIGFDAYDDNSNSNTTEKREWIMGDVLHSKPLVVNYNKYTFDTTNEANCDVNKTMIFVGTNDGMLHAFKDCDGSEAWAFIPKDLLKYLQYVHSDKHAYLVDSSAFSYVYDQNKNGVIESGDQVLLLIGMRRGGGTEAVPTKGYYYVLDVTDPAVPKFLWSINNSQTSFSELAEAWSDPKIVKVKTGSSTYKVAAVFGGGYDNPNEDLRYGATQSFPAVDSTTGSVPVAASTGAGAITSAGASAQTSPKGRGIFMLDMATGNKIWSYTWGSTNTATTNTAMTFSVASEVAALDTNARGYIDRLYAVDTGGSLWRFDVGTSNISTWSGRKVFSSNPGLGGTTDVGRKAFYKPAVTLESGYDMVFFGTGDREHPLNSTLIDRIYAIKVKDSDTTVKTENDLVDVTTNQLQATYASTSLAKAAITSVLSQLKANSGWFIRFNEAAGEKVLSSPIVFNKVLYVTTFTPLSSSSTVDACTNSANLGLSNLYALNYLTGEAVLNYNYGSSSNDSIVTNNTRATSNGVVLQRIDRKQTISAGIASSPVVVISNTGKVNLMVGGSGDVKPGNVTKGGVVRTLFWRQK